MIRYYFSYILVLLGSFAFVAAQETSVPMDVQYPLMMKVLSFDRNLKLAEKETLNIGVVYQRGFRKSLHTKEEFVGIVEHETQQSRPLVRTILLDLNDNIDIASAIHADVIDVLYVAPLRAGNIVRVVASARATHTLTITGVPEFVDEGATVGIGQSDGKPQIVINLIGAKAEGADFSSHLLKVAKTRSVK